MDGFEEGEIKGTDPSWRISVLRAPAISLSIITMRSYKINPKSLPLIN